MQTKLLTENRSKYVLLFPESARAKTCTCNRDIGKRFPSPFSYPFHVYMTGFHPQYPLHQEYRFSVTSHEIIYLRHTTAFCDLADNLRGFTGGQGVAGSNPVIPTT